MLIKPCNPNASAEVQKVLRYLNHIEGKAILTGQHTQTREQEELAYIRKVTGKLPALCGFELLSYSPNINRESAGAECLKEVDENAGTLLNAMNWAEKKGLITFTWHWFSPLGGHDKSFFTVNTEFDARQALIKGTPEYEAMCSDLDVMAGLLQPFCERKIPILWRPFHEAEGDWFWWSAKGAETAKELYRFMFRYFTEKYDLNNLIWVWNSPAPEGYVGDEYCDIITRDLYPPAHEHTDLAEEHEELKKITKQQKGTAVGEIGVIPDIEQLSKTHIPWLWYMTWSHEFCIGEKFNSNEELNKMYHHKNAITLDVLPELY